MTNPPEGRTPEQVHRLNIADNDIDDPVRELAGHPPEGSMTYEEGRKIGYLDPSEAEDFKLGVVSVETDSPPAELGESALGAVGIEEKPNEIKIEEPSMETVKYWPEEFKYIETADGTNWLCAIDSKGNVFAKIKATASSDAGNTKMLFEVTQPILNEYRQKQRTLFDDAETTLGKAA